VPVSNDGFAFFHDDTAKGLPLTRAFAYLDKNNLPMIGVEWREPDPQQRPVVYNFTRAWDLFKQIKLNNKAPQFNFLQVMLEMDVFHAETFDEVFTTLKEFRPLRDLILNEPYAHQVPIARPQKILGVGRNYREHAKELKNPLPSEPIFFGKSPSAMIAHREAVRLPKNLGQIHHEAELAVVIGKAGANIAAGAARDFVAGYTILNDVTARELQKKDTAAGLPWFRAKNIDTFCPIGPYLIPSGCVADPQALDLKLTINGEIRQQGTTADMVFPITDLISYISRFCTLQPGDIIATGTPAGVGPLQAGDTMVTSITGLGELINPII
jgi:2-keto-4-pentenoate hydratase/2-oxohepta-3-ene-1,7-dioic acid hydratase in catechol pathway